MVLPTKVLMEDTGIVRMIRMSLSVRQRGLNLQGALNYCCTCTFLAAAPFWSKKLNVVW